MFVNCFFKLDSKQLILVSRIDVYLRRIGGAFGIKISRSIQSAVACSLIVHKLHRPCRFIQPLTTNMQAVGKRMPCTNEYEVSSSLLFQCFKASSTMSVIDRK